MRPNKMKRVLKLTTRAAIFLLVCTGFACAQVQQINITAGPSNLLTPDGQLTPMWGYTCGSTVTGSNAACSALNHNSGG